MSDKISVLIDEETIDKKIRQMGEIINLVYHNSLI